MHWRTKPEVSAYMYTDFEPDLQRQIEWVQSIQKNDSRLDWIIVVDDEEVKQSIKILAEHLKIVAEPGGAVAATAVLTKKIERWQNE